MKLTLFMMLASVALVGGCGSSKKPAPAAPISEPEAEPEPVAETPAPEPEAPPEPPAPKVATAKLAPTAKSKVSGTFSFREVEGGVEVTADVAGLKAGDHAYHVHENGDCSAKDGSSAGGHFNPGGHPHGAPDAEHRHEGDLGNLTAGKNGKATKTIVMKGITLGDDATSIMGKAMIVHEKKDDFKTQPTGNAGGRLACGVIEASTP
ncbi:MAG: superoxide dismutase family protein [Myxococcota bacterium]|nr:superoxide dismutase family protein [Myxococcota bacterium]